MATAALKPPTTDTEPAGASQTGGKRKSILIAVLFLALIGGGLAWYFLVYGANKNGEKPEKAKVVKHVQPVFLQLEPFTVNLKPDGQFLQASFTLQIGNEDESNQLKIYLPKIRSHLLLLLSNKTVEELSTLDGKRILTNEIASLVAEPYQPGLEHNKITNVFITSFVIQ